MPCSTQESQNLTQIALADLCSMPLTQSNFLTPLATDLDNIREQSFMDDGSSCSRLIAPDHVEAISSAIPVNISNTNILFLSLSIVSYPSRLIITGKISMAFNAVAVGNNITSTFSTNGYMGAGGSPITSSIINKFIANAYTEDEFVSYMVNIPAGGNPTIYLTSIGTIAGMGSLTASIQVTRVHQ